MKGSRYSEEQIIGILREAEAGLKTAEVCRRHGTALIAANNPRGDASPFLISKPIMILYGDAGMAQFTTLTEQEEQEFWRLYRFYWKEAERCEEAKDYLAACVMLGSALEALLVLMINVYDEEADATGRVPTKGGKSKPVPIGNLNPDVLMMKPAEDRYRCDAAELLGASKIWSIFIQ